MLWFDRGDLDADVYASLKEETRQRRPRVLAWARTPDGIAVGLQDRLSVRRDERWTHVPWVDVVTGGWEADSNQLAWTTEQGSDAVELTEPGRLPELFRERVQASIVISQPEEVPGTSGIVVTARRNPADPRGDLRWRAVPKPGTDLSDPALRPAVEAAIQRVRAEWDFS